MEISIIKHTMDNFFIKCLELGKIRRVAKDVLMMFEEVSSSLM
ncbi:hypothetical protein [Helicobacter typhlonius]